MLKKEEGDPIIKHKGAAKDIVTSDWFSSVYADLSKTEQIPTSSNFRIDWKQLKIVKKDMILKLGLPRSIKRVNVYNSKNEWIDTRPIEVIDIGNPDATTIIQYELSRINDKSVSQSKNKTEDGNTKTIPEDKPTLFINKPKKSNKAKS